MRWDWWPAAPTTRSPAGAGTTQTTGVESAVPAGVAQQYATIEEEIRAEGGETMSVTLEVLDTNGKRVARKQLRFYYAEFFHYAENFSLPSAGDYTLRARIDPPPFPRHGEKTETPALTEGAQVEFEGVRLEPEGG